jgi:hypothetical protein
MIPEEKKNLTNEKLKLLSKKFGHKSEILNEVEKAFKSKFYT